MEESKDLQSLYKIFRTFIYLSLVVEFFEYAIKRVCQNVHILFFMHKAPTFSSQGFAIS